MQARKKKQTHQESRIHHAKRRFRQYYHQELTKSLRRIFKQTIKAGLATIVREDPGGILYSVPHKERNYLVVYNPKTNNFITILPPPDNKNYNKK